MKTKTITYEHENYFVDQVPLYLPLHSEDVMTISLGAIVQEDGHIVTHYFSNVHHYRYLYYRFHLTGLFTAIIIRKKIPSFYPAKLSECINIAEVEFEKDHLIITFANISEVFNYWEYPELQICKLDDEDIDYNMHQFKTERCYTDNRHHQFQKRPFPIMDSIVERNRVKI